MKKYKNYFIVGFSILAFLISICFVPFNASSFIPMVEEQVSNDLGVKIHIERLILRVGPFIKVKAPIMHVMYEDGQKFAQFDNIKFYLPWTALLQKNPVLSTIYANKLTVRVNSDDKFLYPFLEKLETKEYSEIPNVHLKEYSISFLNKDNNDTYSAAGQLLEIDKIPNCKNMKYKANGNFSINTKQYINYDLAILPKFDKPDDEKPVNIDFASFITKIKEFDFHSDVVTDLKLYKTSDDYMQASGFINIDNISVLDNGVKTPKSFIYLTLWGDKASILSNIYTSVNKKVYIEGMINNSKKLVLDLKVKTDEISLADLYKKIQIIADFSRLKGIKSVSGTMNANFTLKGDLNRIKSNGYMKLTDAKIQAEGLQIERINSEIDFSNNTVNIVNAVGYVNNAPIRAKGSINKNINIELLMDKVELKYLCPVSFGVKSGIASLVANISGTLDNIVHKENLHISNLKLVNKNADLSFESLNIDTNKNNTAYINNIVCKTPETSIIKIPTLKLLIEHDKIKIPETSIFMPNSKIMLKSEIANYNNNDIAFNTMLNGYINSKDINALKNYSTRYPVKLTFNGNKNIQNLNTQILLEKTEVFDEPAVINLISKIEKNNIKIEDLSLISFSGKFSDDFKANQKGQKKITITGGIDDIKSPVMKNVRLFIPQQLNINIADSIAQVKGDLFINGKLDSPDIIGQVTLQNLFNQAMQMTLSNCTLDFNKNYATINAPSVKVGDSTFALTAVAQTGIKDGICLKNVNVKSKYMNADTFIMYKENPLMKQNNFKVTDGKFYSERVSANLYGSPLYLTAFSSDFNLQNNILGLKNISSELFNGKLAGNLNYDMRNDSFDSQIMARGISAAQVIDIVTPRKEQISGTMDVDLALKGELTSKQTLNGNVKFVVHNGRMATLGKLEHLLYAQNVVADNMLRTSLSVVTKAITLKDTGLFKYLRGDIRMENGIAHIDMLQSQGPLMTLFIKGQYNPMNDHAKLNILGRLSDEVVSGLGAFGDFSFNKLKIMLTGEDVKHNIVPEDFEKLPSLPTKNTKEFRSVINGVLDKPSSVILFNWISHSQKSLKQKDVPMTNVKLPAFVDELPY